MTAEPVRRAQSLVLLRAALRFDGRSRRRGFWMALLVFVLVVSATAYVAAPLMQFFSGQPIRSARETAGRVNPLITAEKLLLVWPATAMLVRRGHDRGYPAARTLAVWVVFLALGLLAAVLPLTPRLALQTALLVYLVADYGLTPGTRGLNAYGPDPRAAAGASA